MEKKLAIKLRKYNRLCPIAGNEEGTIKVGQSVIVITDRGEEFGTIVSFPKKYPKMVSQDVKLKKVLRYATEEDLKIANSLESKEADARCQACQKIKEYELKIRIIDVGNPYVRYFSEIYFVAKLKTRWNDFETH